MKKNLFFGLCAASMLLMTSCEKDSFANLWGEKESEVANVTLSVSLPELQTATRAYGEGKNAENLQYAVYSLDANYAINEQIEVKNVVMDAGTDGIPTKELVIKLIPGTKYSIVLWADAYGTDANSPFTVKMEKTANTVTNTVTVDAGKIKTSDDNADAFFGSFVIDVESATSFSIYDYLANPVLPVANLELKRPFAQLNIASTLSDFNILKNSGFDLTQTTVKVENAYTSMDLRTGEVLDGANATSVSFALNDLPTDQSVNTPTHKLLSVNYILMSKEKYTANKVVFTYSDGTTKNTKEYTNVPLQRNWRTNIYGDLFTDPVDITVSIAPSFANQTDEDEDGNGKTNDEWYNGENGFPNNSTPNP